MRRAKLAWHVQIVIYHFHVFYSLIALAKWLAKWVLNITVNILASDVVSTLFSLLLKLACSVHLFELHLSLGLQIRIIDKIPFDWLYNSFGLTVD